MRPRVRSYGESSTATLSPARIRMKFFRIFPEMCASTWCLFSSSTRNIAFGSGSITVAITSMASSLGNRFTSSIRDGRGNLGFALDDLQDFIGNLGDRLHPVHFMVDTQVLIKLHQRIRLLAICPEPLENQILAVIGPMNKALAANVKHCLF